MLLLAIPVAAMDLRVKTSLPDITSRQYFCNPCYVTWSNETDGGVLRTALGSSNYSFTTAQNGTYTFIPSAEMLGFNETGLPVSAAGSDNSTILRVPISAKGQLAVVGNGAGEQWFDTSDDGGAGVYPQNWERKAYSYQLLKNISKSFGYGNVNAYGGSGNYSLSGSYASNAFVNYETVLVGYGDTNNYAGANVMSATLVTALETARSSGTLVYVPAYVFNKSVSAGAGVQRFVGGGNQPFDVLSELGMVQNGTNYYPLGHDLVTLGGKSAYPLFVQRENPALDYWGWYAATGTPSYIYLRSDIVNGNSGTTATTLPLYRVIDEWRVVPSYWHSVFLGNKIFFNPALFALMYNSLDNYGTDTGEAAGGITVSTYEGSPECSRLGAVAGVLCCFKGSCASSSAAGTRIISKNLTYVSSIANPESELRGDASDLMLFYATKADFDSGKMSSKLSAIGTDKQRWFAYSDTATKTARVLFMGAKRSTTGDSHYFVNYNFYDTYMDVGLIFKPTDNKWFEVDNLDSSNSDELTFCESWFGNICTGFFRSCTDSAGNNWNYTLYYGVNETSFNERRLSCQSGVVYRTGTDNLPAIPDFDMSQINWYYGIAPTFTAFDIEIGENDTTPIKLIQSNRNEARYNWLRQFVLFRFDTPYVEGRGGNTDTGAYIDMVNSGIKFRYNQTYGGNLTIAGAAGTGTLTCSAPSGYKFAMPDGSLSASYSKNMTVTDPVSVGVQLEKIRALTLKIHVTSDAMADIDNAKCSLNGFADVFSTNGYCVFNGVQVSKNYNATISTSGAEAKVITMIIRTGDYYDSEDMDKNGKFCGTFDGIFTVEAHMDRTELTLYAYVRAASDRTTNVVNALVNYSGQFCKTDQLGRCQLSLPYSSGVPYDFTVTKKGYILPLRVSVAGSQLDCDKNDVCSYIFYVNQNPNATSVNGDGLVFGYSGNQLDVDGYLRLFYAMITSPIMLAMALIAIGTGWGFKSAGIAGTLIGATMAVIVGVVFGLMPLSFAFGFFLVFAAIFALIVKGGVLQGSD